MAAADRDGAEVLEEPLKSLASLAESRTMSGDQAHGSARAAVARALGRLDAYSFFVLPAHDWNADYAVVGTTGAFLVAACDLPGVAMVDARRPVVGDRAVPALRKLRAGGRGFAERLSKASALATVVPIVCLTHAIAGPPIDAVGVRFVKLADLSRDISARPRVQSHTRAQAAARALGVHVAGDHERHFTVRS